MNQYKIDLDMGWKFIVTAKDEDEAIEKVLNHSKSVFAQDGFGAHSTEAQLDIQNKKYSIEFSDVTWID